MKENNFKAIFFQYLIYKKKKSPYCHGKIMGVINDYSTLFLFSCSVAVHRWFFVSLIASIGKCITKISNGNIYT